MKVLIFDVGGRGGWEPPCYYHCDNTDGKGRLLRTTVEKLNSYGFESIQSPGVEVAALIFPSHGRIAVVKLLKDGDIDYSQPILSSVLREKSYLGKITKACSFPQDEEEWREFLSIVEQAAIR